MKYILRKIKTKNNNYIYDAVSSNILEIEDDIITEIDDAVLAMNEGIKINSKAYNELLEAIQNGLIAEHNEDECSYWFDEKQYEQDLKSIKHLLIGVTEKCNLRCKYCVYGGHYKNERIHSEKEITEETVKNAINLFVDNTNAKHVFINFYGGEPFANFEIIKKASLLLKQKQIDYRIVITTNGTLINDEVIDWFLSNDNIYLYISLAGTEELHNKLRVYKGGKEGTFSQIKHNLMKIKMRNKSVYSKRINFVFNIFDEKQLFMIRDFWNNEEMFLGIENLPEITMIDCLEDDGTVNNMRKDVLSKLNYQKNPLEEYITLLKNNIHDDIFVNYYDSKFLFIHKRDTDDNSFKLFGMCRPFIHKLFVNVDGDINVCENYTMDNYFGNVNGNHNIYSVKKLLKEYKEIRKEECSKCWARKLCSLCYKDIYDKNGKINKERARKLCKNERNLVEEMLTEYCTVLENDSDLLNHLDEQILVE